MNTITRRALACSCVWAVLLTLSLAAAQTPQPTGERVRVKAGHANVHMGSTTVAEVLVLAPKGTILPVLARRGEWVQVAVSPALRKTGMVMRWYKNEDTGWIHDSMLEMVR